MRTVSIFLFIFVQKALSYLKSVKTGLQRICLEKASDADKASKVRFAERRNSHAQKIWLQICEGLDRRRIIGEDRLSVTEPSTAEEHSNEPTGHFARRQVANILQSLQILKYNSGTEYSMF